MDGNSKAKLFIIITILNIDLKNMDQAINISTLDTTKCKELLKHFMDKNQTVVTVVPPLPPPPKQNKKCGG